jgi:hypothetical protein
LHLGLVKKTRAYPSWSSVKRVLIPCHASVKQTSR